MIRELSLFLGNFAPFVWLADLIAYRLLGLSPTTRLGESVHFFFLDITKVFTLLIIIVFGIALIRSYLPPEKVRKILKSRFEFTGNILAAVLGIVTPFCSCSAIPMFIGFIESGVPLGVTFSFLISSPTVNEVAIVMLWGLFGWKIAILYMLTGLSIAIIGGFIIGKLGLEKEVEEYVYQIKIGETEIAVPSFSERRSTAWSYTKGLLKKIWIYIFVGIGLGALIHGYIPINFVVKYAGKGNPLAVFIAVLIGIPLYSNAAGTIPIVQALIGKGLPMGTALAFMMSVVAISMPELVILRKVLKPKLLVIFTLIIASSIVIIGYMFNLIL